MFRRMAVNVEKRLNQTNSPMASRLVTTAHSTQAAISLRAMSSSRVPWKPMVASYARESAIPAEVAQITAMTSVNRMRRWRSGIAAPLAGAGPMPLGSAATVEKQAALLAPGEGLERIGDLS